MRSPTILAKAWNLFRQAEENLHSTHNALKTAVTEHERIHAGKVYHHSDVSTLAAAGSLGLLMTIDSDTELHLRDYSYNTNGGPCELYLYENPFVDTASIGTYFAPDNLNTRSSNVSVHSFHHNPYINVNSIGIRKDSSAVLASAGGPVKTIQGAAQGLVTEWVLKPGNRYLMNFTNVNGGTILYNSNFTFYEPGDH